MVRPVAIDSQAVHCRQLVYITSTAIYDAPTRMGQDTTGHAISGNGVMNLEGCSREAN